MRPSLSLPHAHINKIQFGETLDMVAAGVHFPCSLVIYGRSITHNEVHIPKKLENGLSCSWDISKFWTSRGGTEWQVVGRLVKYNPAYTSVNHWGALTWQNNGSDKKWSSYGPLLRTTGWESLKNYLQNRTVSLTCCLFSIFSFIWTWIHFKVYRYKSHDASCIWCLWNAPIKLPQRKIKALAITWGQKENIPNCDLLTWWAEANSFHFPSIKDTQHGPRFPYLWPFWNMQTSFCHFLCKQMDQKPPWATFSCRANTGLPQART